MKRRLAMTIPIAILGALVVVSPAGAQRGIGAKPAPLSRAEPRSSSGMGGSGAYRFAHPSHPFLRGRGRGWGWGSGWGWAYLPYPDYDAYSSDYESVLTEAPPWQGAAPPWQSAAPERVIHPILIERQGDQWVQVSGYNESPASAGPASLMAPESTHRHAVAPGSNEAAGPPRELPPAVLVFRDGHEEEVKSYTIIGNTMYVRANYWNSGSWTRAIEISNLDVPATLKLNQERGSKFSLPSGPQEVVIRM